MKPKIRMLFFPAEAFPTIRVRLTTLFGRELLSRGHEIDLVMQAQDGTVTVGRHAWHGRSVWVGPTDRRDGLFHRFRKHARGLVHDLRWLWRAGAEEYDCILVSDKFLLASIASLVARLRGQKFFFWLTFAFHKSHTALGREGIVRYPKLSIIRGYLESFVLYHWIVPLSHHVFVQSPKMATDFCARGADAGKLTPVLTGIDTQDILPAGGTGRRVSGGPLTVGYLGTLGRERRLEVLVDMLADLRRRGLTVRLLLVGDGDAPEDRQVIDLRARECGVTELIEITGFLPREQALDRIKAADICVSPIYPSPMFEGASPTKLVEYMALGLPVVANTHPDQSTVLRQSRAGVCVPWGARHFARAVHWLSARSDEEFSAFGQRGRAWVEANRSYSKIADEFERACLRSISGR